MKKQYRLATFALSACLLMACGARETNAPENNEAEKQTENISNIDTKIDEAETSGALTESESRETPIAPKEILIDFTGISEFHPEGTAAQPYSLEILSETYNNITFADEWYNASEDISLPMIGENWDCFYDENYTISGSIPISGRMENSAFSMVRTACMYWNIRQTNGTSTVIMPALRTEFFTGLQ